MNTNYCTVIIPIYNGYEAVVQCINSVIESLSQNVNTTRVLLIDDCSSDTNVVNFINEVTNNHSQFYAIHNEENLGFTKTINVGLKSTESDVILLNSDTIVHGNWIDRLYAIGYQNPTIGTVTPLSNNATICSYPKFPNGSRLRNISEVALIDDTAWEVNGISYEIIPTCVGFCVFIKRSVINTVGILNSFAFPRGYGEENDFSIRCTHFGYINICALGCYVGHVGSISYGTEKHSLSEQACDQLNKMYPYYGNVINTFIMDYSQRIHGIFYKMNNELLNKSLKNRSNDTNVMVHVLHGWGGGTEKHVNELCAQLEREGTICIIIHPHADDPNKFIIRNSSTVWFSNLSVYDVITKIIFYNPNFVHYHHVIDVQQEILELHDILQVPYFITIHDYFMVCPRINMITYNNVYCGAVKTPEICNKCIKDLGKHGSIHQFTSIEDWRSKFSKFLQGANLVIAPSQDVYNKIHSYFPDLTISIKRHSNYIEQVDNRTKFLPSIDTNVRVLLLGAFGVHKGSRVILEAANYAKLHGIPLEFIIIGYTDIDSELLNVGNITITGKYDDSNVNNLIARYKCHIAWFPAIWPETYSYTLSVAFMNNIPCIGFKDVSGAIQQRILATGNGALISSNNSIAAIVNRLYVLGQTLQDINITSDNVLYDDIIRDYYHIEENYDT